MLSKNLVIAIYSPPDYYPPTLNAIEYLTDEFDKIYIVYRNYDGTFDWVYPKNVFLISSGKKINVRKAEVQNIFKKFLFFFQYVFILFSTILKYRPDTILIYDYMPILAFRLISPFIRRPRILWYHNHDVADGTIIRKWSLAWFAWKSEKMIFKKLNIFSLPSLDRREYFPMEDLKGDFFFIPNFPSIKVFSRYENVPRSREDLIKIVYQGSVGPMHGFEEIISILKNKINGKNLELTLIGNISDYYKKELLELAKKFGVGEKLSILPPVSYKRVIEKSAFYNIGNGIYRKDDIMNRTLGTASNKIYEYAAGGLPVILFDNLQFRINLERFSWAFFTDCSKSSLIEILTKIDLNFEELSKQAKMDFESQLNFEKYFKPVCIYLRK